MEERKQFGTLPEIFELTTRVMADDRPKDKGGIAVAFAETAVNTPGLLSAMQELWVTGAVSEIAFSGYEGLDDGKYVVPSGAQMKEMMKRREPSVARLTPIDEEPLYTFSLSKKFPPCTDAEALGFVEWDKGSSCRGVRPVYLVSTPLHQLRAFVSLVSAVMGALTYHAVFNYPAPVRGWNESILHSLTAPEDERRNLLVGQPHCELEKVFRYCAKGDHVTAREVLDYMNERNRRFGLA